MAFWDFDKYYYNDIDQEAGDSFREFSEDNILNSTFPDSIPAVAESTNATAAAIAERASRI